MKSKEFVKKTLGTKWTQYIKGSISLIRNPNAFLKKRIVIDDRYVSSLIQIEKIRHHVFCGYYDVPLFDESKKYLLIHILPLNAQEGITEAVLAYYDFDEGKIYEFGKTNAWSWQQGSRLRWSLQDGSCVYYNDYLNDSYCAVKLNVKSGKIIDKYDSAFYDISKDETFAVTCNFSRLQRLRPGYGYNNTLDLTREEKAPEDDGLYYYDLVSKKKTLLIRLNDLAKTNDEQLINEHYINHISISPNSDKIMFFHLYAIKNPVNVGWRTQLCIYDLKMNILSRLETIDNVSHYTWIDNESLLITGISLTSMHIFYRIYYTNHNIKKTISDEWIFTDGHPTMLNNGYFISDTYPDNSFMQHVLLCGPGNETKIIGSVFHDPRMSGDRRCDLHPKVSSKKDWVAIDTLTKNRRSVLAFHITLPEMK